MKNNNENELKPKFSKKTNELEPKFDKIDDNEQVLKKEVLQKENDVSIKVSADIHRMVKLNSLLDDTTMKDYLERLVKEDNLKRNKDQK